MTIVSFDQGRTQLNRPSWWGWPLGVHAFAWGGLIALILLLIGLTHYFRGDNIWQGWVESRGLRQATYAERIYFDQVFRTQANTWSNLAYVLVGLYALALGRFDQRARTAEGRGYLRDTPALSFLFGAACCYLGFGSGLFHASLTRWGQQLDVAGMYPPMLSCLAIQLGRGLRGAQRRWGWAWTPPVAWLVSLVLLVSGLLYYYKWSMSASLVLTTLILSLTALTLVDIIFARQAMSFRWPGLAAGSLGLAVMCRQLDVAGKFSGPDTWLQGHAFWHGLTAASLACLYAYHRSEVRAAPAVA